MSLSSGDLGIEFHFPEWATPDGTRIYPVTTVRDAIGDLPTLRNGGRQWILPYTEKRGTSEYAKLMRKQAARKTIFDHVCRMQNDADIEAFRLMKEGGGKETVGRDCQGRRDDQLRHFVVSPQLG